MHTLVVATDYPWPRNSGSRLRLENTVTALAGLGPVDLFSAVSDTRTDFADPPAHLGLRRVEHIGIDDRPPRAGDTARALLRPDMPFELPLRARPVVSLALEAFRRGPYDLVWFFQMRAWVLAGECGPAPVVVDIDDLEDRKIAARASLPRPEGPSRRLRRLAGRLWNAEDIRRWRRLHERAARHSAAALVCSELDARRAGMDGVRVIPNGYPAPDHPVGRDTVSSPPTVLFQGTLRYPPNADAARFLVDEVGPHLRTAVPEAQIRLVGLAPPAVTALCDPPRVAVTGQVRDIVDELARADLVVIPLRYGSGTRVKILEAFAHRIPVVSTTVGAEGLAVTADTHLLVADEPEQIAAACARVLLDASLRRRLVDAAHALYESRYRSSVVQDEVAALAREITGS